MIRLTPDNGIPRRILLMMAVTAGFTVANLYYNQPLLDMICRETGITQVEANLITVITQIGYALGLLLVVPKFEGIRIHAGNCSEDTEGCILVGKNREVGKVLDSRIWLHRLKRKIVEAKDKGEAVWLTIK